MVASNDRPISDGGLEVSCNGRVSRARVDNLPGCYVLGLVQGSAEDVLTDRGWPVNSSEQVCMQLRPEAGPRARRLSRARVHRLAGWEDVDGEDGGGWVRVLCHGFVPELDATGGWSTGKDSSASGWASSVLRWWPRRYYDSGEAPWTRRERWWERSTRREKLERRDQWETHRSVLGGRGARVGDQRRRRVAASRELSQRLYAVCMSGDNDAYGYCLLFFYIFFVWLSIGYR